MAILRHFQVFLRVKKVSEKPQDHQKWSHHQTNIENVFRDIKWTQKHDINTFQYFVRSISKYWGEGVKIPPPKKQISNFCIIVVTILYHTDCGELVPDCSRVKYKSILILYTAYFLVPKGKLNDIPHSFGKSKEQIWKVKF